MLISERPTIAGSSNAQDLQRIRSLNFQSIGRILVADGPGFRDIVGNPTIRTPGSNDPTLTVWQGGIEHYLFSATAMKQLQFTYHVDHDYCAGTPIYFHTHWTTSGTNAGVVRWGFEYSLAKGHQQSVFPVPATIYAEQAGTGVAFKHHICETTAVSSSELEPDTIITCRIFRDAAHVNDTQTDGVFLLTADLHYQADRFSTKNKTPNFYA